MYYTLNDVKTPIGYSETYSRWQFPMPKLGKGDKLQVFVVFEKIPSYEIKLVSSDASVIVLDDNKTVVESATKKTMGRIDLMTSLGYTDHVAENSMVWVRFFPADGYQLDITKIKITYNNGKNKVTYNSYDSTFKMPAADVTIDMSDCFAQTKHTIAVKDNWFADGSKIDLQVGTGDKIYKDYVRSADDTMSIVTDTSGSPLRFESGKVITVVHETRNGYYPDIIVVDAKTGKTEYPVTHIGDGQFSFVMPLEDVIIIPTTKNDFYNIVAVESANGSFKVPTQAAWGQDVSITEITPADGYEVGEVSITYTDASSVEIKKVIEADADGNYSFKLDAMPLSDVKVEVKFAASSNNLNIVYHVEGTPSASNFYRVDISVGEKKMEIKRDAFTKTFDDGECNGDTVIGGAKTGDLITITPSTAGADDRYEISTVWVLNNGIALEEKPEYSYNQYYFTMPYVEPGKTCEIHIKYALKDESKYVLDLDVTGADAAASTLNGTSFADLGTATVKIGVGSVVKVVVKNDELHELSGEARVTFTDNEGKLVDTTVMGHPEDGAMVFTFGNKENQPAINASPKGAVKFKLALPEIESAKQTITPAGDAYTIMIDGVAADMSSASAIPGSKILIGAVEGKVFASAPVVTTASSGTAVPVTLDESTGMYTFTMPEESVSVSVASKLPPLPISLSTEGDGTADMYVYEGVALDGYVDKGVCVTVKAKPGYDQKVKSFKCTIGGVEVGVTDYENGIYQFNVPAEAQGDVQVSIEFEAKTHAFAKDKEGNGIDDLKYTRISDKKSITKAATGDEIIIAPADSKMKFDGDVTVEYTDANGDVQKPECKKDGSTYIFKISTENPIKESANIIITYKLIKIAGQTGSGTAATSPVVTPPAAGVSVPVESAGGLSIE